MAIRISGTTGIDMGNTSVSNVDIGVLPENSATKQYVDDNVLLSPNDSRVKTALNASGTAPIYACRAWVNFNGTGTVAIRASGNVSSITDNGVGTYTVNFTTPMPDVNYSATIGGGNSYQGFYQGGIISFLESSYGFRTVSKNIGISDAPNYMDFAYVTLSIFR